MSSRLQPDAKRRIALLWHKFEAGNLGVQALAESSLELVRSSLTETELSQTALLVVSSAETIVDHDRFDGFQSVASIPWRLRPTAEQLRVMRAFAPTHAIDTGEGDSFSTIYGWRRFGRHLSAKIVAQIAGARLLLTPQTIGPFESRTAVFLARSACRRADVVFARDSSSYERARTLLHIPERSLGQSSDLAFSLSGAESASSRPRNASADGLHVGVNLSAILASGLHLPELRSAYVASMDELVLALVSSSRVDRVSLLAHTGPGPAEMGPRPAALDDEQAAHELVGRLADSSKLSVEPFRPTFRATQDLMRDLDLFVGARMHGTISALSVGTPCMALAYSDKLEPLYADLHYPHYLDLRDPAQRGSLVARVTDMMSDLESARADAERARRRAQDSLQSFRVALASFLAVDGD